VLLISLPLTQLSASLSWCSADCSGCGMPEVKLGFDGGDDGGGGGFAPRLLILMIMCSSCSIYEPVTVKDHIVTAPVHLLGSGKRF